MPSFKWLAHKKNGELLKYLPGGVANDAALLAKEKVADGCMQWVFLRCRPDDSSSTIGFVSIAPFDPRPSYTARMQSRRDDGGE